MCGGGIGGGIQSRKVAIQLAGNHCLKHTCCGDRNPRQENRLPQSSSRPPMTEGAAKAIARSSVSSERNMRQPEVPLGFDHATSGNADDGPSLARGLLRVGTFFAAAALVCYFFWDTLSESAALSRLTVTAENFSYTARCDGHGNPIETGEPNCVDLNRFVFIHGPINKALRRACSGNSAAVLLFEPGKVARTEINAVQKSLQFHARFGTNSPC